MRFEVTYRNTQGSDALTERARKKFSKVVKYLREPLEAHLTLFVEKHRHRGEITVTAGKDTLKVAEETDDMYQTIDRIMNRLERAARRQKERNQDRWSSQPVPETDGFTLAQALAEVDQGPDDGGEE